MSERCSDSDFHSATISPITVLMRHGFSMANAQRIIVSRVENGTLETFGLHETGKAQVAESAANLSKRLEELLQPGSEATGAQRSVVRIVSSPFSRTRETAMILADVLRGSQLLRTVEVIEDVRLRERNFGDFELTGDENYDKVWGKDAEFGEDNSSFGCESTKQVWDRAQALLLEQLDAIQRVASDAGRSRSVLILVSHGDTLQITQAGLSDVPVQLHRSLPHMSQAEWRLVKV